MHSVIGVVDSSARQMDHSVYYGFIWNVRLISKMQNVDWQQTSADIWHTVQWDLYKEKEGVFAFSIKAKKVFRISVKTVAVLSWKMWKKFLNKQWN